MLSAPCVKHGPTRREGSSCIVVVADRAVRQLKVAFRLSTSRRLTHLLDGRQQQPDKNGNDRYYDQKLNERKAAVSPCATNGSRFNLTMADYHSLDRVVFHVSSPSRLKKANRRDHAPARTDVAV